MTNNDKNDILEYLALAEAREHQGALGDILEHTSWLLFYLTLIAFFGYCLFFSIHDMLESLFH